LPASPSSHSGDEILHNAERVIPADVTTLDALHLVSALVLANAGLLTTMLTYDARGSPE
jgi:hypothetical protein